MIYYCSKKNSPFGILMFITWFQLQIIVFFVRGLETFILFFTIFHMFLLGDVTPKAYSMFCRGVELGSAVSRVLGPHKLVMNWLEVFPPRMAMSVLLAVFLFVSVFFCSLFLLFVCLFIFCCFLVSFFLCISSGGCTYHLPKTSVKCCDNKMKPASG